jgi:hypothetical protein
VSNAIHSNMGLSQQAQSPNSDSNISASSEQRAAERSEEFEKMIGSRESNPESPPQSLAEHPESAGTSIAEELRNRIAASKDQ